ncbi:hypothetical protein Tco_0852199 [Tanacetum coccineum]
MIDADYQMAIQLQAEEQENLTIEEKSKLFIELVEARKKHFATMRAQERRSKLPTKALKRNTMSTYLKNMVGYKSSQLKNKSFNDIQKLFDKSMKRVNTFVDIDTELVEKNEDKEFEELKQCLELVPDDGDDVTIDATPISIKSPSIVDYKIYQKGKKSYFQIIRADARFKKTVLVHYMDNLLLLNFKTMFEPSVEDEVWKLQQRYNVVSWKLFDSCGLHCLSLQSGMIYMLVEKRYPLTPPTITDMLKKKLQVNNFSEMAYQLSFLSSSQNSSRINEVFRSILLVFNEAYNEET